MSKDARLRLIVVAVFAVFIVVLVVASVNRNVPVQDISNVPLPAGAVEMADKDIPGLLSFSVPSNDHTDQEVNYAQIPPVGGPHYPAWQNCGVYNDYLHDEFAVHSLEHGAVWITYQPGLASSEVARLASITQQSSHRLLSPYPDLPAPIVLSAWGYQLRLATADDARLAAFIARFESGPTTPERGASCRSNITQTARELGLPQ
jgi:hypothetical protein